MNKIKNYLLEHKKRVFIILMVLGVIFLASKTIFKSKTSQPQIQTAQVQKATLVSSITASGRVLVTNIINVETQATGVVKKVYVKDGDKVVRGQKIAEIILDATSQQKNASSWASYLSAKNNVVDANISFYTLQSQMFTANRKFINDAVARNLAADDPTYIVENADWLASEAKYNNQKAVVASSKASLSSSWLSYQTTSPIVVAPISGTINSIGLVEGIVLSSSSSTTSSQRVGVIEGIGNPILTFDLTEIDVPKIKVGQKATITLDSITDKTFTGKVVTVDRIGTTTSNVTTYPISILLDTTSPQILPNMTANASIIIEAKSDVLVIPSSAIESQDGQYFVRVLKDKQETTVSVQIGISSDTETEIVSGLSEGDEVVTSAATLSPNSPQNGANTSVFGGGLRIGGGAAGNSRRQ